tara:strand:+ start:381 stop:878 length:498 start_codon:yes stop_codon:yes gene_type:complete
MRTNLTETEKDRIRGLHKNFSVIKEMTDSKAAPCPGPECIHCLPCAMQSLKGTNPIPIIGGPYDYSQLGEELIGEIMALYGTGIQDPVALGVQLTKLWLKYSTKAPSIIMNGPSIAVDLYNNYCENADEESDNYGESLGTNAFGQCLPSEIFKNIPDLGSLYGVG